MGFMDKAKAAATELAAKADGAMAQAGINGPAGSSGGADRYLRDLGVIAYLEATGRPAPEGERERVMAGLREAEQQGGLTSFALRTTPPPPPGMAGATGAAGAPPPPPPPGAAGTGSVPGASASPPPPTAQPPRPATTQDAPPPPPPPPSWS